MNGEASNIAHQLFDAFEHGDTSAIQALVAEDAVIWQNYDQADKLFSSRLGGLLKLGSLMPGFGYVDRRYIDVADGAVLQHRLSGRLTGGEQVSAPMMVRIVVADGRIRRFEEYLDRENLRPLYAAMAT